MGLAETIVSEMRESMKAKQKDKLVIQRMLVSSLENAKVEKKLTNVTDLSDEDVVAVVQKQVKTLQQEIDSLKEAGRDSGKVEYQKEVVSEYLPEQMGEEELELYIKGKIDELGIDSIKMQGKLMGVLSKELKGKADMGKISGQVRELLK